jgi:glycyl-tRNA synthetase
LKLSKNIAPDSSGCLSALKKQTRTRQKKLEKYIKMLKKEISNVAFDDNGNIGKRYRRQDEIGTPWCITIDFDTLEDNTVTVRDRDTGTQERVKDRRADKDYLNY